MVFWSHLSWRRKWQPTPVLLPGKFHGWRSLVGYSPWGHKELNTTEQLHFLSFYNSFWRRRWQPTPVFSPGESHGQRGLVAYRLWGCRELDTTKQLTHTTQMFATTTHSFIQAITYAYNKWPWAPIYVVGVVSTVDAVTRKVDMPSIKNLKFHKISLFACSGFYY